MLCPFDKGSVKKGKADGFTFGVLRKQFHGRVPKGPKAKQGQEKKTQGMKEFIIGPDNDGGNLLRGKGAGDVKRYGETHEKAPPEKFREIL